MKRSAFHTPEGYRDIYGESCEQKLSLEEDLKRALYSYGYQTIELPSVEFASLYTGSSSSMADAELYRFLTATGICSRSDLILRPLWPGQRLNILIQIKNL